MRHSPNKALIIVKLVFAALGMTGRFFMYNVMNAAIAHLADARNRNPSAEELVQDRARSNDFDTFIVNLADEGGARRLCVTMNLLNL